MTEIISVVNQKGGVSKTTTVQATGNILQNRGYSVLFIDLDMQGNLTYALGAESVNGTAYEVLTRTQGITEAITPTEQGDLLASSTSLSRLDIELTNELGKENRLKEALEAVKDQYDYILIDTPPAVSTVVINALTASNRVVIPTQADIYSLQGLLQLTNTLQAVTTYTNPELKIAGILITRYDKRANLTKQLTEMLETTAEQLQTKVFQSKIREAIAVKEAQALQVNIATYAPKSNVVADLMAYVDELIGE